MKRLLAIAVVVWLVIAVKQQQPQPGLAEVRNIAPTLLSVGTRSVERLSERQTPEGRILLSLIVVLVGPETPTATALEAAEVVLRPEMHVAPIMTAEPSCGEWAAPGPHPCPGGRQEGQYISPGEGTPSPEPQRRQK